MANIDKQGIVEGVRIHNGSDKSKQLEIGVNDSSTASTKTTVEANQTANRTITLPDATDTLVGKATTDTLTNKTIVIANNTVTTAASGNLVATELNAALAELQTDIDTRALDADLTAHTTDAVDAHDASAISFDNTDSSLTATDVQEAIDETEARLDTAEADIVTAQATADNHIADTADAHDASAISFDPTGSNLVATDAQAAIDELDTDLATHIAETTAHGITGSVVGTSDTQTLTGKTIDGNNNTISNLAHGSEVDNPSSGVHGVTGSVVGTTDTQTLTNKTLTTPIIDITHLTEQGSTPATPSAGTKKFYAKTDGKLYTVDSSGVETEVGSGGSGGSGTNYITNGKFESDVNDWSTYDDTAEGSTTDPVNGTAGTAAALTLARVTADPVGGINGRINGEGSLKLDKDSVTQQGRGLSTDFTIDFGDADTSKFQLVRFKYRTSANYASGDIVAWIYDVDAAALVGKVINDDEGALQANTTVGDFIGGFTPTTGNTNYRLIFHIATANATPYSIVLDNVSVGPDSPTPTATITDLGTETWDDNWDGATTSVKITRRGKHVLLEGTSTIGSTPSTITGGSGFKVTIPSTYAPKDTPDTDFRNGAKIKSAGSYYVGAVSLEDATTLNIYAISTGATYASGTELTNTIPNTFIVGDDIRWWIEYEVDGWDTGNALSSTEVLLSAAKFSASESGAQTFGTSNETILWDTVGTDNLSGYNAATGGYTIPKTGFYSIIAVVAGTSLSTNERVFADIKVNGTIVSRTAGGGSISNMGTNSSYAGQLTEGDVVTVDTQSSGDVSWSLGTGNVFSIFAVPDFSVFGGYRVVEYLAAESDEKTPTTSGDYLAMTGNSVTLTPGTWVLNGAVNLSSSGTADYNNAQWAGWHLANGADSGTEPTTIQASLDAGYYRHFDFIGTAIQNTNIDAQTVRITVTENTDVYLVPRVFLTTAANGRVTTYIYAERIQ